MTGIAHRGLVPRLREGDYATMDGLGGIMGAMGGGLSSYLEGNPTGVSGGGRFGDTASSSPKAQSYQNYLAAQPQTAPPAATPFVEEIVEEAPAKEKRGPRGGKFGPRLKSFFKKLAELHPATATPMFLYNAGKMLKNSDNPGAAMKRLVMKLGMQKMMGNSGLNLNPAQKGLASMGINVASGQQNWKQGVGSLFTNLAMGKAAPNILRSIYKKHGPEATYAVMAALKMGNQGINKRINAGPGGGG